MALEKRYSFRVTKAVEKTINRLMIAYPDTYKTQSDVFRAGVFALQRWKAKQEKGDYNG